MEGGLRAGAQFMWCCYFAITLWRKGRREAGRSGKARVPSLLESGSSLTPRELGSTNSRAALLPGKRTGLLHLMVDCSQGGRNFLEKTPIGSGQVPKAQQLGVVSRGLS